MATMKNIVWKTFKFMFNEQLNFINIDQQANNVHNRIIILYTYLSIRLIELSMNPSSHNEEENCVKPDCNHVRQILCDFSPSQHKTVWPNGEGTSFRSWGLQVRVLSRSEIFL